MPIFVQLVLGKFDEKKDTQRINDILNKLQTDNAIVKSILPAMAGDIAGTHSVYIISYEAPAPISIGKI